VSVEECRRLVLACKASRGVYMMAENYTYMQPNQIVKELVRQGLFGTPYYAEGEYIHELKHMNEHQTPWRRRWQTGVDGIAYGTHSLGPILQWMPGDRVTRVCCEGAGVRHIDGTGKPYCQASSTMLCKTARDALIKIRVDMLSDRPHAMTNYQLQGTDGCYESARAHGEPNRVWLRSLARSPNEWMRLEELEAEFLPDDWKNASAAAAAAGHGGGDYFEVIDFIAAVTGQRPPAIGIDQAMDMTLPGLASQQSALEHGRWIDVPDSRTWVSDAAPQT
jgi:predicted dehydrogenase